MPETKTILEDLNPDRIVFHFNKLHNQHPDFIPAWTIKHRGKTHYVNHMESEIGFRTKETPDNEHTKAALQFKGKLRIEETDNGDNTTTKTAFIF